MKFSLLALLVTLFLFFVVITPTYAQIDEDEDDEFPESYGDSYGAGSSEGSGFNAEGSRVKWFNTMDEIKTFLGENDAEGAVIGYFDNIANRNDRDVFEEVASEMAYNVRFAMSTSKEVLEEIKSDGCSVYVHKPAKYLSKLDTGAKSRFPSKSLKKDALVRFIQSKILPLVGERTYKTSSFYDASPLPVVTVFAEVDHAKNAKGFQYLINRIRKVAAEHKGKLIFNIAGKSDSYSLMSDFGITLPKKTSVAVGIKAGSMYYTLPVSDSFSADALTKFIADFRAGVLVGKEKVPPPTPKDDDEDDDGDSKVVTLTTDNFADTITNSGKDAMVEFYAPWCGHCKALKPEYKALAERFKDDDSVIIAAMDATAHNPPSNLKVEGYPTLYWLPKGNLAKAISYNEARQVDEMAEFISKHKSK